ncbi:hypothetical protein [Nostoc sp.]|uniref:hypothetical protein n=1 Tax=Nostoc sp. TaxID=1180 RepID=UPI002FFC3163
MLDGTAVIGALVLSVAEVASRREVAMSYHFVETSYAQRLVEKCGLFGVAQKKTELEKADFWADYFK